LKLPFGTQDGYKTVFPEVFQDSLLVCGNNGSKLLSFQEKALYVRSNGDKQAEH